MLNYFIFFNLNVSFHRNICNVSLVYTWTDLLSTKIRQQQTVSFCNNLTLPFLTILWKRSTLQWLTGWHGMKTSKSCILFSFLFNFCGKKSSLPVFLYYKRLPISCCMEIKQYNRPVYIPTIYFPRA